MSVAVNAQPAILFREGLAGPEAANSLLGQGISATWAIRNASDLAAACSAADAARSEGQLAVFALNYEAGWLFEAAPSGPNHLVSADAAQSVLGYLWILAEAHWLTRAEADAWLSDRAESATTVAGCVRALPTLNEDAYAHKLQQIRTAIRDGEVYQVNFTFAMEVSVYGHPACLFRDLAQAQPTAQAVYIDTPESQVLSFSPELFFSVTGDQITVRPMKGTAPRGTDSASDKRQAEQLQESPKNRAENLMIVDLLRNDLGRIAVPGSVDVDQLFAIESYPTLHQMTSIITATLKTQRLEDLLRALFPCGSITGAPKLAAMQKIAHSESTPRGLYTGTIGWAYGDHICASVAIRTLLLKPSAKTGSGALPVHQGVLGVGSGITWDSDPAEEYAECLLKSDFLVQPDPGFTLFETLRLELPAAEVADTLPLIEVYPYYRQHQARLQRSAYALGFKFDAAGFECCLWGVKAEIRQAQLAAAAKRTQSFRVRIDLTHSGQWSSSWSALPALPERVPVICAAQRLPVADPLRQHKTSCRAIYDAAIEQALAAQAFDSLFCNEYGEVCEGARSNIFVREGQRLLTPPVRCGLLPGVLRGVLLAHGEACESVLTMVDIKAASREGRLRVGNALRGLLPAYLK